MGLPSLGTNRLRDQAELENVRCTEKYRLFSEVIAHFSTKQSISYKDLIDYIFNKSLIVLEQWKR